MAAPRTWIKARRTELCMSQSMLAKATNVAQRTIERWESGEMEPSLESRMDIASSLDLPISVVHEHLAKDAAHSPKSKSPPRTAAEEIERPLSDQSEIIEWKTAQSIAQGAPAERTPHLQRMNKEMQLFDTMELQRLTVATDLSSDVMTGVRDSVDLLCRAYPGVPAARLLERTQQRFRHVMDLLRKKITLSQHRELIVGAGWLAALLGCTHYDLGHREAAETARRVVLQLGNEAEHAELQAWAFEMAAWFSLVEGRYADLVDAAHCGLAVCNTGSIGVQLFLQQAKGYARLGDRHAALTALERGATELAKLPVPKHPEHHFVFDHAKWSFYVSAIHTWLGHDAEAEAHAHRVIDRHTRPDGATWAPMRLAGAHIDLA
ncbi:MAG: helix-turn-helix transcriptional regulator [Myxococcota bacterium]